MQLKIHLRILCGLILLTFSLLTGCGGGGKGTVSGTITVGGEPMKSGTISFFPAEGEPFNAGIVDGKYITAEMPPGTYQISIMVRGSATELSSSNNPAIIGSGLGAGDGKMVPKQEKAPVKEIDPKYIDPTKSGLSITVKAGPNTFDKDL